ncbi:MAG: hypothetical protein ACI3W5_07175 [Faecousia sp.]
MRMRYKKLWIMLVQFVIQSQNAKNLLVQGNANKTGNSNGDNPICWKRMVHKRFAQIVVIQAFTMR